MIFIYYLQYLYGKIILQFCVVLSFKKILLLDLIITHHDIIGAVF